MIIKMNTNENTIINFAKTLRNYNTQRSVSLYSENKNQGNSEKKYGITDVISGVAKQLKAIQNADNIRRCSNVRSIPNIAKTSNFLPVHKVPVEQPEAQIQSHKLETQCVLDTQLIYIIENAEAIIDAEKGITQEFNTTFCHKDPDSCNIKPAKEEFINVKVKKNTENESSAPDSNEKNVMMSNFDKNKRVEIVNVGCSITHEFDNTFHHKDQGYNEENNSYKSLKKNNTNAVRTDTGNKAIIEYLERKNEQQDPYAAYQCNEYDEIDILNAIFDAHEDDNNIFSLHETIISSNGVMEEPKSPILNKIQTKAKSKTPSPLIFELETFEKFESIALHIIENHNFETAKKVINSQIHNKELFIHTNAPCTVLHDRDKNILNKRPILKFECPDTQPINRVTYTEDSMIFSSDEDEDDVLNDFKELQSTCTLNNSLEEKPGVIDELMYVGFQTASDKSIQVYSGSYSKAKSIFDNITNTTDSHSQIFTKKNVLVNCNNAINIDIDTLNIIQKANNKVSNDDANIINSPKMLNEGLKNDEKYKNLTEYLQIDKDLVIHTNTLGTKSDQDEVIKSDQDEVTNSETDSELTNVINKEPVFIMDTSKNVGFRTADNNKTSITCEVKFIPDPKPKFILRNLNNPSNKSVEISKSITSETKTILQHVHMGESNKDVREETCDKVSNTFKGFTTASNKSIVISETALAKTKELFQDIDIIEDMWDSDFKTPACDTEVKPNKAFKGFTTASNKPVVISESALEKSKKLFQDIDVIEDMWDSDFKTTACDTKGKPSKAFKGFTTASNTPVVISESALEKTKKLFQDIDVIEEMWDSDFKIPACDTEGKPSKAFKGFSTASNKPVAISESALEKTKKLFQDIDVIEEMWDSDFKIPACDTEGKPSKAFKGFSTASNKPVAISESALAKSKKLFQDVDIIKEMCESDFKTPACDTEGKPGKAFKGFTTASNKPVVISESALDKTKKLFQDIDAIDEMCDSDFKIPACDNKVKSSKAFEGFTTGSNKPVVISESVLTKSMKLFQDVDIIKEMCESDFKTPACDTEGKPSKAFKGFTTASNKPVVISESALDKTKKLFQDIDAIGEMWNSNYKIPACDNKVKPSKAFGGFTTASNKPVAISESALAISKNIFQDIDNNEASCKSANTISVCDSIVEPHRTLQGFTTAYNKPVKICKRALENTKKVFQGIDTEIKDESNDNIFKIPHCNKASSSSFQGFKTANVEDIPVTEKQVTKYKDISQDIGQKDIKYMHNLFENLPEGKQVYPVINGNKNVMREFSSTDTQLITTTFENESINNNLETSKDVIDIRTKRQHSFSGFNTCSNKKVKISENALLKSRQVYQNIDFDLNKENCDLKSTNKLDPKENVLVNNFAYKTASKNISAEALINDLDKALIGSTDSRKNQDDDILEEFNTEVIKDFEETVYTEDFVKNETPKSKRSGSPILSCPKAKKVKKFETPLITKKFVAPIKSKTTISADPDSQYKFNDDYKKNKKYNLKELNEIDKLIDIRNIDPYISTFELDTLLTFEFKDSRNDIDSYIWTADKIKKIFENSVNKRIVPDGWINNHMKLIIWKLISYEIRFPVAMKNVCTVRNILEQLKYRYRRELYNVERPALMKILERDEVSTRRMILCVAGLFTEGATLIRVSSEAQNVELLLTDGWYTIKASTDRMIARLVYERKISVGTKLVIQGAELLNCDQGIAPWEDTSLVRLKISGNSTRRARWDARLGFHGNGAILTRLSAVKAEGGRISQLRTFVTRVYPTLYIEKFPDGSTVTRSERLEHDYQMKYETERQNQLEKLYEELERFSDQESQDSEGHCTDDRAMDSGSQISRLMKKSRDREEFRANLTSSQASLLQQHSLKKKEKLVQSLQNKFHELVKKRGLDTTRNVVPLLKIRVADVDTRGISKAMITIWKPSETIQDLLAEGTWVDMYNVVPTSVRYSEIQISAGRQSLFQRSKFKETDKLKKLTQTLKRQCYTIKNLQNPSITTDYNEVDTVGLIFMIEPQTKEFEMKNQPFQNVYITDEDKNIICVNFWGGIKKFGFQNILEAEQVVACFNLQKRAGNTKKNIPQYRATEFSFFTKTSKMDSIRKIADNLAAKFSSLDKRKFMDDCIALKNNYQSIKCGNISNISPYRLNISDYNIYKNKAFIDSPLVKCTDVNLNLSGLDFESTFKQVDTQDMTPQVLLRKRKVNEKIATLKMYGEPPPLSAIHIINKSSDAEKAFRSPFAKNDISASVANPTVLPGNMGEYNNKIDSSPILNRTYVNRASINPVKLNFSNAIDTSTKDPFAEEFEGSPPLSLDINFIT